MAPGEVLMRDGAVSVSERRRGCGGGWRCGVDGDSAIRALSARLEVSWWWEMQGEGGVEARLKKGVRQLPVA